MKGFCTFLENASVSCFGNSPLITKVMHHFEGPFLWGWAHVGWAGRRWCAWFLEQGLPPASGSASRPPGSQALVLLTKWSHGPEILEKPVPNRDRFVNKCKICSADQLIKLTEVLWESQIFGKASTLIALDLPLEGWKWNIPGCHFNAAESGWSSDLLYWTSSTQCSAWTSALGPEQPSYFISLEKLRPEVGSLWKC